MTTTNSYANSPRDRIAAQDRKFEAQVDSLVAKKRANIEAQYGAMSDEEYNEIFG